MTNLESRYLTDTLHDYYQIRIQYRELLHEEKTPFQHIKVVDTDFFGRVLILDGIIQLTEYDNHGYHEMITNIPMLANDNPEEVLIVGGGDGGALRQTLRYPSLKTATIVELDQRVIDVCIEYFPEFENPFAHPKTNLVVQDAFEYLVDKPKAYDVIIADTTDPVGDAENLFSRKFYEMMWASLKPGGVIVTQCEQMFFDQKLILKLFELGKEFSSHPAYYHAHIPTYPGGGIGFLYISDTPWQNGLNKPYPGVMQYLNPDIHEAAFALPEFFRKNITGQSSIPTGAGRKKLIQTS